MRWIVHHIDTNTFLPTICLQPVVKSTIRSLAHLSKHVRQNGEGTRPVVDFESVGRAGSQMSIFDDTFLVLDIPGEQHEHVLNVSSRKIPYSKISFDSISFRHEYTYPSYNEYLSSHFSYSWYFSSEDCRDFMLLNLLQDVRIGINFTELMLKRYKDKFTWILSQKLGYVSKHGAELGNLEGTMINVQRLLIIQSEIKVSETCSQLVFYSPTLALIDDTQLMASIGTSVMRARYGDIGDEEIII